MSPARFASRAAVALLAALAMFAQACLADQPPPARAESDKGGEVTLSSDLQKKAQEGSRLPPPPREGDARPVTFEDSPLRREVRTIQKGPEFAPEVVTHTLKFKKERKPEKDEGKPGWLKAIESFFRMIGEFSRVLVWVGGALLILGLLFSLHYWWRMSAPGRVRARGGLPTAVGGLDIRPESLPADVAQAAREAWARGEREEALSLLYRGALSALVVRHGAAIRASSTEQECVRAARKVLPAAAADYFADLTQARLLAIYARRWPSDEKVMQLCADYARQVEAASAPTQDGMAYAREAA